MTARPSLRPSADALASEDSAARADALDVTRSFLVQAPAGSGKTELLVQRFLALLARVERPERIVALTFTRKAAAEMRERIVGALRDAEANTAVDSAHELITRQLASAALEQDRRHAWHLVEHPARLQVQTFDALCAAIARQAPLTTGFGGAPRFDEQPHTMYAQAARDAIAAAAPDDDAWQRVLQYFDNDANRTADLLADMLGKRELWLGEVVTSDMATLRGSLKDVLAEEIIGELSTLLDAFPASLMLRLRALESYATDNLRDRAPDFAASLHACATNGGLPPAAPDMLDDWRALARWLLVGKEPRFATSVDVKRGFPPKGRGEGSHERAAHKLEMEELLAELAELDGLGKALDAARHLPQPDYGDDSWAFITALFTLLPRVAAQLALTFRTRSTIDYAQATRAAIDALGDADAPSDLLLKLDLRISHLLIDEFQDTSYVQQDLLQRLTAGWQAGDGRTLFCVGDPMQSIYKFRQAEVRLFVEAQQNRAVGNVPIESLVLRRNFRSRPALVDWANGVFGILLGAQDDPWRSLVAFSSAIAARPPAGADAAATIDAVESVDHEAARVVQRIRSALELGAREIAVLVRARTHLSHVLPALRAAAIPFTAVELDSLADRQIIIDLTSLTHALLQPTDRLAWLSVLRAPWCGLVLEDLFAVCAAADAREEASIAAIIVDPDAMVELSVDGRRRLARVANVFTTAFANRARVNASARVRGVWLALGGPACVDDAVDLLAAERFFSLLDEHQRAGDVPDWAALIDALERSSVDLDSTWASGLALTSETDRPGGDALAPRVSVMTLHRAKGLEFDTVIIPGLARKAAAHDTELLRWRRRPEGIMLGPAAATGGQTDSVANYLAYLASSEDAAELARLLYVGCTRARERLHLIAAPGIHDKNGVRIWRTPPTGSLWGLLTMAVQIEPPGEPPSASPLTAVPATERKPVYLRRVPASWRPEIPSFMLPSPTQSNSRQDDTPVFDWARETAKHIGTVAHQMFAQLAEEGLARWPVERIGALQASIGARLALEGIAAAELPAATSLVQAALRRLLEDARGRWLFDHRHQQPRSEYAITVLQDSTPVHVVLDRTFVDGDGTRWVVDFKLSRHEGADLDTFIDNERERYRPQLETYAQAIRAVEESSSAAAGAGAVRRPVRLGIYFPLLAGWREWESET